ncbi:MAG: site-2 protease family protein, partial [Chloroflexota bacterium]
MENPVSLQEQLNPLIEAVFEADDVTVGAREDTFIVRYRGQLKEDSVTAYDKLAEGLKKHNLTPLFREEEGTHVILLVKGLPEPKQSKTWVNVVLFIFTLFSMLLTGALQEISAPLPSDAGAIISTLIQSLPLGLPFGLSLLGILLAHEFGHYFAARYHKSAVTLPYFIPFPFSPFGTMGAFIQLKEPPKNKRILHDIGVAGPLAGLIVTIPVLLVGLSLSTVET